MKHSQPCKAASSSLHQQCAGSLCPGLGACGDVELSPSATHCHFLLQACSPAAAFGRTSDLFYLQGNFLVYLSPNTAHYQQQHALFPDSLQAKCLGKQQDASQPCCALQFLYSSYGPPTGPSLLATDTGFRVLVLFFLERIMDFEVHPCADSTVWDPLTDT